MSPRQQRQKPKWWQIVTAITAVGVIAACIYIMSKGLGLNQDLDFGAGAYYYTDVPEDEAVIGWGSFKPALPYIVYVALFLAWGYLMWLLWKWVDKK